MGGDMEDYTNNQITTQIARLPHIASHRGAVGVDGRRRDRDRVEADAWITTRIATQNARITTQITTLLHELLHK